MSTLDHVRAELPLEVAEAQLGSAWVSLRGPASTTRYWSLRVESPWSLERRFEVLLTDRDEEYGPDEESDAKIRFMVGRWLTDVEGSDPDGGDIVFVFDHGEYRLRVYPDDTEYESYVFSTPTRIFVY